MMTFLCLLAPSFELGAQDEARFFKDPDVDFWGGKPKKAKTKGPDPKGQVETLFAEPSQLPDGRVVVHTPPQAVLRFLEEPTKENARGYLEWQRERIKRLRLALEKLSEVATQLDGEKQPDPEIEILYFKRYDCPYCVQQDAVLAQMGSSWSVKTCTTREDFAKYQITSVPVLVLRDTRTGKILRLTGYAPKETILGAIKGLRSADPKEKK
jgi:hypothetical protein